LDGPGRAVPGRPFAALALDGDRARPRPAPPSCVRPLRRSNVAAGCGRR